MGNTLTEFPPVFDATSRSGMVTNDVVDDAVDDPAALVAVTVRRTNL